MPHESESKTRMLIQQPKNNLVVGNYKPFFFTKQWVGGLSTSRVQGKSILCLNRKVTEMLEEDGWGWVKRLVKRRGWCGGGVKVGMEWNGILYIFFSALIVHILLSATQIRSYSRSTVASCFRKSETISGHWSSMIGRDPGRRKQNIRSADYELDGIR